MSFPKSICHKIEYSILSISVLLATSFASPLILNDATTKFDKIRGPLDNMYILPEQNIDIYKYSITLTPYFNNSFTFDANTIIECSVKNNTVQEITLHAKQLRFSIVKIIYESGIPQVIDPIPTIDDKYDFWNLKFNRRLSKDQTFKIEVNYVGIMSDDFYGFYKTSYEEKGQTKWLGTTQFQPVHARRVFPCFDEPKYKAKFAITIRRPKSYQPTLSNMKMMGKTTEGTDYLEERFYETPKMSTYLLAFVVSEFEPASKTNVDDTDQFGIWARKEAQKHGSYAFEITIKIVESMVQYLLYPISKMDINLKNDHVAIPEMPSGAMENWGINMYREANLMYNAEESSVRFKQQVAVGSAHEIAHSWFGNLVTCQWWSELWLNEGFATFFQIFLTDRVEKMDMEIQFNVGQLHPALELDAFVNSPPLKNEVYSPDEISSQFNPLTYNKGAALIRMIRDFVGAKTFQNALIKYINETNFDTANEEILCKFIQNQADNDRSIESYVNTDVYSFVTSWTNFNGFPLISVSVDRVNKIISIGQKRFMKDLDGPSPSTTWHVPITYTTRGESNFYVERPKFIFTDKSQIIRNVRITDKDWIIFNIQQSGYYRVFYDDLSWKLIIEALSNDDREYIHPQNRAQLVDDLFNFARENIYSYTKLLDAIQFLELESHFAPWSAAFSGYSFLRLLFQSIPDLLKSLDKHILTVMSKTLLPKLEFYENNNDNHIDKLFRINAFNLACQMDYKECVDESMKLFEDFTNNKHSIKPNLREYVYCTALRHGTGKDFDFLWKKYLVENTMNEKPTILNALGCSNISDKLIKLLFYTISQNSPIRKQDKMTAFNSIISGGSPNVEIAFQFIQENFKTIRIVYGTGSLQIMFQNIALRMNREQVARFEELLLDEENYLTLEEKESGLAAVRTAKTNMNTAGNLEPDLKKWFDNKYNSAGILSMSWLLLITTQTLIKFNNLRSS